MNDNNIGRKPATRLSVYNNSRLFNRIIDGYCCNILTFLLNCVCVYSVQEECARLLLFRGTDKRLCNTCSQTASQLATLSGFQDLAALIDNFSNSDVG